MKRPVLGVLGFGSLASAQGLLALFVDAQVVWKYNGPPPLSAAGATLVICIRVLGVLLVMGGLGSVFLAGWAYRLLIVGATIALGCGVVALVGGVPSHPNLLQMIVRHVIVDGVVLWYFLRPGVKAQFQQHR